MAALLSAMPHYVHLTPYAIPLDSDNEMTLNVSLERDETHTLTVIFIPAGHCPGPVIFLLVSKEISVLFTGNFRWQVGHTKQINHLLDNLQADVVKNFDNNYIDTTFCKTASNFILCGERSLSAIFQAVSAWLCFFQIIVVQFFNKTRYGYEFSLKELALRFNTKVHISLCQYQLYKFVPSIQNWLTLDGESTKIHSCKPSSASANLKLPCKPGIPCPEVLTIILIAMLFTRNETIPGRLVKAESERTIRCFCSSHSSADEIIDFLSSLQFKSITSFVFPDKDTPLDSMKAFILDTLNHQNPNTSNDPSTKLWKENIKFIKRGKRKLYLEKTSSNTPDYEYHSEPLRQENTEALSKLESLRKMIQKEQKNCPNCSTIFKNNILLLVLCFWLSLV